MISANCASYSGAWSARLCNYQTRVTLTVREYARRESKSDLDNSRLLFTAPADDLCMAIENIDVIWKN